MVEGPDSIWQDVCWTLSVSPTRLRNGGRSGSGMAFPTSRPKRPGSLASPPDIPSLRWNIVPPLVTIYGYSRQWNACRHHSFGSRQLPLLRQMHPSAARTLVWAVQDGRAAEKRLQLFKCTITLLCPMNIDWHKLLGQVSQRCSNRSILGNESPIVPRQTQACTCFLVSGTGQPCTASTLLTSGCTVPFPTM